MPQKTFTDCMVVGCQSPGHAHVCPGDGRTHGHGAVHTVWPSHVVDLPNDAVLELGEWGWLCRSHFAVVQEEWDRARNEARARAAGAIL